MRASSSQAKLCLLSFARGFDDLGEAARIQAGTADEGAVDVRLAHEFACVLWFHAAAILNAHPLGRGLVSHLAQGVANKSVRFLRLSWRGVASRADGPDRLVRDHCFLQFLRRQSGETPAQLDCQDFLNVSSITLLERFSNASN